MWRKFYTGFTHKGHMCKKYQTYSINNNNIKVILKFKFRILDRILRGFFCKKLNMCPCFKSMMFRVEVARKKRSFEIPISSEIGIIFTILSLKRILRTENYFYFIFFPQLNGQRQFKAVGLKLLLCHFPPVKKQLV